MSLKSEKKIQRYPSEQLDLVETINDSDKMKKKRFSIILFLILTVGISLCFLLYRQFKNTNFQKYKISGISLKLPSLPQSKFSPVIRENWSVFVKTIGTTDYFFSSESPLSRGDTAEGREGFDQILVNIKTLHDPSYAKKYLPDGVIVSEKINTTSENLEIYSIITTPKVNFEIYTKIPGSVDQNSSQIDEFSKLVEKFYWHLLK